MRLDKRAADALRPVSITVGFTQAAPGSVLIECGRMRVICTVSVVEGVPGFLQDSGKGWLTAEYAMLPGATAIRKRRDNAKNGQDGRSVEIQRFIGRSLRSVLDLYALSGYTLHVDCDVIEADGGTRTAAITGAFVALVLAVEQMLIKGWIVRSPVKDYVAAVSCGICADEPLLDLCYQEDSGAQVDANFVMTGGMDIVEMQGAGEQRPMTQVELQKLIHLAQNGIRQLIEAQKQALGSSAAYVGQERTRLVVATANTGKAREIRAMLGKYFGDIQTMREYGLELDIIEDADTFMGNALKKARAVFDVTKESVAVLSDDSGLMVDALGGAPGVYSARFAGEEATDAQNNERLLYELRDVPEDKRGAQFVCAAVLILPDGAVLEAQGSCRGSIAAVPFGDNGFGYDSLFIWQDGRSFAQLRDMEKNAVSHRRRALMRLMAQLEARKHYG